MDLIMELYEILEVHCLFDPDRDCSNRDVPDCAYCLARHLAEQGVSVKGAEHGE